MSVQMNRRDFLKTGMVGVAATAALGAAGRAGGAEEAAKPLPTIKLGTLEVSRFILGSNPFWGYSHKNPQLDEEMKTWHTDERIIQICDEAARCGLTTIVSAPDQRWLDLWAKYRAGGGKLTVWVAQCHGPGAQMIEEIDRAIKGGAKAVFIQGHRVEQQFEKGKFDVLRAWLDRIKNAGLPGGYAAHWPNIHPELEKRKFPTDFYFQCCYNITRPNPMGEPYHEADRKAAMETIAQIEKPVVAYKILGAGRLHAADGFEQAFNSIRRKDGVCAGIWAKEAIDQIRENATLTEMLTAKKA
ncbi:MAG: twin-arginine translocation signal domain-containing protein [Planctomycetota bacterium]|nr:twin-arginine translocation signal domain-containing protein [Planctomycetota bacterium]